MSDNQESGNFIEQEDAEEQRPQYQDVPEADENQSQQLEQYEQVMNLKLYLVEDMREKKKTALSKFVLYKELLHRVQIMEVFPHCPSDVVHSKEAMVEELEALKTKHLRQLHFYDQLVRLMLASPDTDETVMHSMPPIYRPFFC